MIFFAILLPLVSLFARKSAKESALERDFCDSYTIDCTKTFIMQRFLVMFLAVTVTHLVLPYSLASSSIEAKPDKPKLHDRSMENQRRAPYGPIPV